MPETRVAKARIRISLTATPAVCEKFCLLTGGGFRVSARCGCSVRELLCGQLGVPGEYLEGRIQTIFLNGQVVDDPDVAQVPPGSTVALSAAMPGVAGAMLRKKSRYAPMRSGLSYASPNAEPGADVAGEVVLKLFNLLQRELGLHFLRQGIRISGRALRQLLERRGEAFRTGIVAAEVCGEPAAPSDLLDLDWANGEVVLTVRVSPLDKQGSPTQR